MFASKYSSVGLAVLAACMFMARPSAAQEAPAGGIEADGTVDVPGFRLPPSIYLSDQAKAAMPRRPTDQEEMMFQALKAGKVGEMRARVPEFMAPRVDKLKAEYGVVAKGETIAGVPAIRYAPAGGVPAANRRKIMLNLPGGGFVMAHAGGTGAIESIPLAGLDKVEIVSITYRQAPEFAWPAGTDDAVKVYRELLKTHRPQDIAVFGCSAGGLLTAELMAALGHEKLPLPKAIGIFCASADARRAGDSAAFNRPFQAIPPREGPRNYFRPGDDANPLASPILDPAILKTFPPTLLITATRAHELSAAVNTHRELVKAGVDADLHVWDGFGHAFWMATDLPEAKEAYAVMARFFRKHLALE